MKYREITVYADGSAQLEALIERLTAAGTEELMINDPADVDELIEGSWAYTGSVADRELLDSFREKAWCVFYLGENESPDESILAVLKDYDWKQAVVDDEDWLHKWEEYYVPFNITTDIVVKPVWRDYSAKEGETVIDIDPGLAFGTGSSPTTYLAARLLEKYIEPGMDVIDAGCGTGILSVIAAKCGARDVLALDIDPEAVLSTENNARLNDCANITAREADLLKGVDYKADLVIGNLLAPLVMRLSEDIPSCGKEGVLFVASGIIDDMEEECVSTVKANGFEITEMVREDCWTAFAARYAGKS